MDLSKAEKIYEGKFSIVYKIQKNENIYVLKQLHPRWKDSVDARQDFKREASVEPVPNVGPKVVDCFESEGNLFLVREFIEGITLREIHKKFTRKKYHSKYRILYQKLHEKIKTLHEHGIIHGDIKPSNILITTRRFDKEDFDVYLLDLGLAFQKNNLPEKNSQKPLHFSMWYGAPELMLNEPGFIGEHTDRFSMGICMYESFSGEFPYKENHPAILLQMMLAMDLKQRRKIPGDVFEQVKKMCLKPAFAKPAAYYSATEIKNVLRENTEKRKALTTSTTR